MPYQPPQSALSVRDDGRGIGFDIASSAISNAESRRQACPTNLRSRLNFFQGGIEALEDLASKDFKADLATVRDTYYLLDETEQKDFWSLLHRVLRPEGVVYLADLAVHRSYEPEIDRPLIQRQSGGRAIRWWNQNGRGLAFSVDQQAISHGFVRAGSANIDGTAIRNSYLAAARIYSNDEVKDAYQEMANIASVKHENKSILPYIRLWYEKPIMETNWGADTGFGLQATDDFAFEKILLRKGSWMLPRGKWSLVVGRSGVGKSTLLRLLAGWMTTASVRRIGMFPKQAFVLSQAPSLVDELSVLENLLLFQDELIDKEHIENVIRLLGLEGQILQRKADTSLSGGERQRVALGQALIAGAELLILDEPFSGVDKSRKVHLLHNLKKVESYRSSRVTVICVDHDFPELKRFFDHIFEMRNGRIIEVET